VHAFGQRMKCSPPCIQQFAKRCQDGSRAEVTEEELLLSECSLCPPGTRTRVHYGFTLLQHVPFLFTEQTLPVLLSAAEAPRSSQAPWLWSTSCYLRKHECSFKAESATEAEQFKSLAILLLLLSHG